MNITVYLSSKSDINENFQKSVEQLGAGIGEMGARLIYGGSDAGQMHILAETAKRHGATVTGIIPETFRRLADPIADEMVYTLDLNERKARMIDLGQIFVALPGGIGTVDEVMSTLASMTVARNFSKKIILINIDGVFDPLISQLKNFVSLNLADQKAVDTIIAVDSAEECISIIKETFKETRL